MENSKIKAEEAFKVNGNWDIQSKKLKAKFSQLTDSDLKHEPGKANDLLKRIGARLNMNREEVINILKKN